MKITHFRTLLLHFHQVSKVKSVPLGAPTRNTTRLGV